MSESNRKSIRRALLSVSDKNGLADLGRALSAGGVELVATSSTAQALIEAGLRVTEVSQLTGFPEILGGRVKTLHPAVHGGLLARQNDAASMEELSGLGLEPFDLVAVNLYPFQQTLESGASPEDCIEMIDIGGPTLLRAAAKNSESIVVLSDPSQYSELISSLSQGGTTAGQRLRWATAAFQNVAEYDVAIATWMTALRADSATEAPFGGTAPQPSPTGNNASSTGATEPLPEWLGTTYRKRDSLRYGENPHQAAALYATTAGATLANRRNTLKSEGEASGQSTPEGLARSVLLGGKPLSFNNLQDSQAAWKAARGFLPQTAVAIIKHTNPCGLAVSDTPASAHQKALACDPLSAFGGVVASNSPVDAAAALSITKVFTEVVLAPEYTPEALEILRAKPNLRILRVGGEPDLVDFRQINGGLLVQEPDTARPEDSFLNWRLVAGPAVDEAVAADLEFAWRAAEYVKSNAIVLAKNGATVGVGMGQVNRVDSAKLAVERANTLGGEEAQSTPEGSAPTAPRRSLGSVAGSDAFFPFPDGLQVLADAGVLAVVAPGGSKGDAAVIAAAKRAGISLYFTHLRHFAH